MAVSYESAQLIQSKGISIYDLFSHPTIYFMDQNATERSLGFSSMPIIRKTKSKGKLIFGLTFGLTLKPKTH